MVCKSDVIELSPRTGRPIVGEAPRDNMIGLRVTATTVDKLNICAKITGKTKTALIEKMIDALYDELMENKEQTAQK